MKFLSSFFTLAAIAASALASPIEIIQERQTTPVPPKDKVYIKDVHFAGSGCPPGSVSVAFSEDLSNVNLLLSKYSAQTGPKSTMVDSRKNCAINFNIVIPQGFTYTIFETEYTGFVELESKVTALQKTEYWFTGFGPRMNFQQTWTGPNSTDFNYKDQIPFVALVWSPCGFKSTLNVNTQIRVDNSANKSAAGMITLDAISGTASQKYHIMWKECNK